MPERTVERSTVSEESNERRAQGDNDSISEPNSAGPSDPAPPRAVNRRSRSGCLTCRRRRIKCDESRPRCARCTERSAECEWPPVKPVARRHRNPRALRSCENCRQRKTKCDGPLDGDGPCRSCVDYGLACAWSSSDSHRVSQPVTAPPTGPDNSTFNLPFLPSSVNSSTSLTGRPATHQIAAHASPISRSVGQLSIRADEAELVSDLTRLYFSTVHYFGYLSFIHEADYWDRVDRGNPPVGLTLLMAANALRFGGRPDAADKIDIADRWASEAGDRLVSQAMQEFGAIELMEIVLYHQYEFQCGRYSRGWVLAGMAVRIHRTLTGAPSLKLLRMMTFLRLHQFDESPHPHFKPLLGAESLRRLAWAVYYLDATIDGGNYGFTAIPDGSFTIPLPCDEQDFLRQTNVSTEHMLPSQLPNDHQFGALGLAGHMLRAMYVRQILAGLHSRIQRRLIPPTSIPTCITQAESESHLILGTLPREMDYSRANFHIFKGQQTLFLHLHVLRNTCLRHLALLKILSASFAVVDNDEVSIHRQALIREARQLSALFAQGVDHNVVLDPQLAMHAYNGIEVLLYQPLRQTPGLVDPGLSRDEISRLLKPLLRVIREVARVSELVALLYPEAVNRMIRLGFTEDLVDEDMMALLKKVHRLANADTEFDFHDSFWRYEVALQRHRGHENIPVSPNDLLLEVQSDITRANVMEPSQPSHTQPITSPLSRLQTMFGPMSDNFMPGVSATTTREQGSTPGELDWQAAFSLPSIDLQTLMGAPSGSEQTTMPFPWSFNGPSA